LHDLSALGGQIGTERLLRHETGVFSEQKNEEGMS